MYSSISPYRYLSICGTHSTKQSPKKWKFSQNPRSLFTILCQGEQKLQSEEIAKNTVERLHLAKKMGMIAVQFQMDGKGAGDMQRDLNSRITMEFSRRVYETVAGIPYGRVVTYGQVAELVGVPDAAQEVGVVMSRATPQMGLPCHRVVNKTGTLSPEYAFGGPGVQRAKLEEEGILFTSDGRIDMLRHQWNENEQLSLI